MRSKLPPACVATLLYCVALQAEPGQWSMQGESLLCTGNQASQLAYENLVKGSISVRSTYEAGGQTTIVYEEGVDYTVDYTAGTMARTPDSRIPDFASNVLYGQKEFDHTLFPGFGNTSFFVFVDYQAHNGFLIATKSNQVPRLVQTSSKLSAGGPFKIIAYGDSISAGGDATSLHLQFQERYAAYLRQRFPKVEITVENGATGGDSTVQGLARLEEKVLTRSPDLVLVGFGMNDHNVNGVPLDRFESNLISIVEQIRSRTAADVILISTFPPNDDWKFGSHRMEDYAAATRKASESLKCAYADVYSAWVKLLDRKEPSSLLGNNINHPNDFGHWIYFEVLKNVEF
ncbi:MAG: hypothetical protein AMXMBFR84_41860 [Candidatus Hydrogenedentota bacterium]